MSDIVKQLDKWIANGVNPVTAIFVELATEAKAEIERLTAALATAEAERDELSRTVTLMDVEIDRTFGHLKHLNSVACDVVDYFYGERLEGNVGLLRRMEALRIETVDDGREPQPAAAPAVDAAPVDSYKPTLGVMRSRLEAIKISLSKSSPEMREIGLREIMYLLEDLVDVYAEQHKGVIS